MDDCSESSFRSLVWYGVYFFLRLGGQGVRAAFDDLLAETVAKLQTIETWSSDIRKATSEIL